MLCDPRAAGKQCLAIFVHATRRDKADLERIDPAPEHFTSVVETSAGAFSIEVHRDWAPYAADRFHQLARCRYFDESRFFRVVEGRWAQFGIAGDPALAQTWRSRAMLDDRLVRSNVAGTIAFANTGPGTRSTQVFINLADNSAQLDHEAGFAPFGRVVSGMDVVLRLYSGYGETSGGGMRRGLQDRMFSEGNRYLDAHFPKLDRLIELRADNDKVDRHDHVQQARNHQNKNAGDERHDGLNDDHVDGHGAVSLFPRRDDPPQRASRLHGKANAITLCLGHDRSDDMHSIAADNLDRLVTVEIRRPGVTRGFKSVLYDVARAASPGPLVLGAAEMLNTAPQRIGIVTGAAVPVHMPAGENDGPFGSVVLAGVLKRIGHSVTIYTDPECAVPVQALLTRAGQATGLVELQRDDPAQQEKAASDCDMLIAVERLGGNPNGHIYGMTAQARDGFRAKVDRMFLAHAGLGQQSLGIGDGGNEVGFGGIRAELVRQLPHINQADKTPCGGGVFSTIATTRLVVGSTSNLAAYAVCAALALIRNDLSLCHTPEEELAIHHVGVGLGLADGGGGGIIASTDGIPADANAAYCGAGFVAA
eukprot:gene8856-8947_t